MSREYIKFLDALSTRLRELALETDDFDTADTLSYIVEDLNRLTELN